MNLNNKIFLCPTVHISLSRYHDVTPCWVCLRFCSINLISQPKVECSEDYSDMFVIGMPMYRNFKAS